ncbi:hypothetical protein ZWY2020_052991 [Hordeum vulgare]|nr:hypothetical protein ZWY2020_052991 [Hordeum vulgare]
MMRRGARTTRRRCDGGGAAHLRRRQQCWPCRRGAQGGERDKRAQQCIASVGDDHECFLSKFKDRVDQYAGVGRGDALPAGTITERPIRLASLVAGDDGGGNTSVSNLGNHAGYYRLPTTHDARLFYFFFKSRRHKKEDPVVIWLAGGPGCSNELALFYENGPFHIADNMSLLWNEFGLDQEWNLIYVDQPTGTGFNYSSDSHDTHHNEAGVSNDLYDFPQAFFKEHPEYVENDFYITGESYDGHYIPAFATRVYKGNKNNEGIHINLKGFAIGNGHTDPAIQYKAYTDYALDMGTSGTVSCLAAYFVCNTIFSSIRLINGNKNYCDIRKPCVGSLCYDFSNLEKFLNLKSVRQSLGVGDIEFVSCSPSVYQAIRSKAPPGVYDLGRLFLHLLVMNKQGWEGRWAAGTGEAEAVMAALFRSVVFNFGGGNIPRINWRNVSELFRILKGSRVDGRRLVMSLQSSPLNSVETEVACQVEEMIGNAMA